MTPLHTAARMALDALEAALSDDQPYIERCKAAITALREALAAPMPEPVAYRSSRNNGKTWIITEGDPTDLMPDVGGIVVPLYAAPPAAPAPVVPRPDEFTCPYCFDQGAAPVVPDGTVLHCGHPASLAVKFAETGETLYCDLCDAKSGRRDAEQMEAELREENLRLREAAKSTAPVVREPQPLVEIRRRATPCGECHLQPGERCDICGAHAIEQAHGIGGGGNG